MRNQFALRLANPGNSNPEINSMSTNCVSLQRGDKTFCNRPSMRYQPNDASLVCASGSYLYFVHIIILEVSSAQNKKLPRPARNANRTFFASVLLAFSSVHMTTADYHHTDVLGCLFRFRAAKSFLQREIHSRDDAEEQEESQHRIRPVLVRICCLARTQRGNNNPRASAYI